MGLLSKLARFFTPRSPASRHHQFQVKCSRCGEILMGRLDVMNDPSLEYESDKPLYFCCKVLIGSGHCHQQVETTFMLDETYHIIDQQVSGGEFIS